MKNFDRNLATRATRKAALASFGVVAFLMILPLLLGKVYYGSDSTLLALSNACAYNAHDMVGGGWLTPLLGDGLHVFGNHALLTAYPLRWLFAALGLSPDMVVSFLIWIHLSLSAAACTWLARTFRIRPGLAIACGVLYAFSGPVVDLSFKATFTISALTPALAWAGARTILYTRRTGPIPLLLTALAPTLSLLGGDPQGAGVCLAFILFSCFSKQSFKHKKRRLATIGIATVVGVLIGLTPWWSGLAEGALGPRSSTIALTKALEFSLEPFLWPATVFPRLMSEPFLNGDTLMWFMMPSSHNNAPWNPAPFLGIATLCFALFALSLRSSRKAAIAAIVFLLFSLGRWGGLLPIAATLFPPLALFRYPSKYLVAAALACSVAGCIFVDRKARGNKPASFPITISLSAGIIFALGLCLFSRVNSVVEVDANLPAIFLASGGLTTLFLALILGSWRINRFSWIPFIMASEMAVAAFFVLQTGSPLASHQGVLAQIAEQPKVFPHMVPSLCVDPNAQLGSSGTSLERYQKFRGLIYQPDLQACEGLTNPVPYTHFLLQRSHDQLVIGLSARRATAARALGCSYFLSYGELRGTGAAEIPWSSLGVAPQPKLRMYKIDDSLRPVFSVDDPKLVDEKELGSLLSRGEWDLIDDPKSILTSHPTAPADLSKIDISWPTRDEISFLSKQTTPFVLGFRTRYLLGWHAEQSGKDIPTVRVLGQHLGVVVTNPEAGEIRLYYSPPRYRVAMASFGIGVLGLLILLWAHMRKTRRGVRDESSPAT